MSKKNNSQNCKVGSVNMCREDIVQNCRKGQVCFPRDEFAGLVGCKICKKII